MPRCLLCSSLSSQTQNPVHRLREPQQVAGIPRRRAGFHSKRALVSDLHQTAEDSLPIDVAFEKRGELPLRPSGRELEILKVDTMYTRAEREEPILRVSILHDVSCVEVDLHKWAFELIDKLAHVTGTYQKLAPNVLRRQRYPRRGGQRQ